MTADQRSYNLDVKHKYFYMDRRSWRGACGLNWDGGHLPRLLSFLYVEFIFVLLWKTIFSASLMKITKLIKFWIQRSSWSWMLGHTDQQLKICGHVVSHVLCPTHLSLLTNVRLQMWELHWLQGLRGILRNCSDFTRLDEGFWCAWESTRDFSKIFGLRSGRDGFYGGQLSCQDWVQV